MIGKTVSHYKILEKIGGGGMGVVYKAKDLKLERQVAIKFLPEHLTKDKDNVERFEREAKTAAALNHPNIVTIYEIAEEDDSATDKQIFIVMEYVDGKSLREILNTPLRPPLIGGESDISKIPSSEFRVPNALNIITQIAEGLSRAHQAGIVHRDIKPENIIIDKDARVRILDFGLAKLKGVSKLTKDNSTLGTVHYMSPEQIQGKDVDQRSDIWSLGVVLYELLTDEVPFKGEYEQAVAYAILNEEPKLLKEIESKHSPEVSSIITKMILKDRENRYQNCIDLLDDLKRDTDTKSERKKSVTKSIYTIAGIIAISILLIFSIIYFYPREDEDLSLKSLAVIPFTNIKKDSDSEYLGDALAAEIIRDLMYVKNITVLPFSTVQNLENWKDLNVDYLLTGSFIKEADIIRLNIELVNKRATHIIWQESVEEEFNSTFRLLDDVSHKVITGLRIQFSRDEQERMQKDVPKNPVAYDYYQLSLVKPTTTTGNLEAINLLEKSIEYDSTYAPAYNQLGFRIHSLTSYNLKGIGRLKEAEIALNNALRFNPELLSALGNLARIYTETGRLMEAQKLVQQMLDINQNNAFSHFVQGYIYRYAGLLNEARREMEMAVSLDPTDRAFRSLGITYFYLGEYDKALKAFDIDKGSWYALTYQGMTLLRLGKSTIAREYFTSVIDMDPESFSANLSSAYRAYIDRNRSEGLQVLLLIEQNNPPDADMWYLVSSAYALLGDKKGTLRTIRKAVEGGFYVYPYLEKYSNFDFVRNEPEFQRTLEIAKEKHESYRKIFLSN